MEPRVLLCSTTSKPPFNTTHHHNQSPCDMLFSCMTFPSSQQKKAKVKSDGPKEDKTVSNPSLGTNGYTWERTTGLPADGEVHDSRSMYYPRVAEAHLPGHSPVMPALGPAAWYNGRASLSFQREAASSRSPCTHHASPTVHCLHRTRACGEPRRSQRSY